MPMVVTIVAFLAIAVMSKKGVKGSVFWGIIGGFALYYLLGLTVPVFTQINIEMTSPFAAMKEFASQSFGAVFKSGFDFSAYSEAHGNSNLVLTIATTALGFCMIDMFDTIGTLFAACDKGNMLTEKGEVPNMEKAMFADAAATTVGAVCGTSTVTTLCRVCRRRRRGRKTGLSSMFTAIFFVQPCCSAPIAQLVPSLRHRRRTYICRCAYGRVGQENRLERRRNRRSRFLTMVMMPFAYNISYGIAFGLISYHCHKALCGKGQKSASEHGLSPPSFVATLLLHTDKF